MEIPSRKYESLTELVYQYLQNQIIQGKLKPGEKIKEKELVGVMDISRTPVREALIKLETEGFLSILPRRGFIVKELTLKEISDIYQTIGCLEGYAASQIISNISEQTILRLKDYLEKMSSALMEERYNDFTKNNILFHKVYLVAFNNSVIIDKVALLKKRIFEYPTKAKIVPEWYQKAQKEHLVIMELFETNNAEEVEKYIRDVHWNFYKNLPYIKKELFE